MLDVKTINAMSKEKFYQTFRQIIEGDHCIISRLADQRPISNTTHFTNILWQLFSDLNEQEIFNLANTFPTLSTSTKTLSKESTEDHEHIGITKFLKEEESRLLQLNVEYQKKFGFPFIMCVRNYQKEEILPELAKRLKRQIATELSEVKEQIKNIACIRLKGMIQD